MTHPQAKSSLRLVSPPVAWPLVPLYALAVRLKNSAYDLGLLKPWHLSWPVVSIGNLSVGGTGKTPLVLLLTRLLEERGWFVDVLSRGYKRLSKNVARVDPRENWRKFGDEPSLMARRGLRVYVGADRYQAGLLAESDSARAAVPGRNPHILHILDDGFQHRRLARSVDIVLLRRSDMQDKLLPLGRLRESLTAMKRADICVLRPEDADLKTHVLHAMGRNDPARVWVVERKTVLASPSGISSRGLVAAAFCAIGDAEGFFHDLRRAEVDVRAEIAFRDHHVYTDDDIERIQAAARNSSAQCFITNEKDSVRLADQMRMKLEEQLPLVIAGLELSLHNEAGCLDTLESLLLQRTQTSPRTMR